MKEQLNMGNGLDSKSTQGPLINLKAVEKVNIFSFFFQHMINKFNKKKLKTKGKPFDR
jgi:hypothetical protein